jgi:hypothetical protein
MAQDDRQSGDNGNGVNLDADKLKEGVDQLLQKDQLSNDKSRAGDKPGMSSQVDDTADKAKETLKDFHD